MVDSGCFRKHPLSGSDLYMQPHLDPTLFNYFRDSLKILESSLGLYRQGAREQYRVMAGQLRLLLCDTTRAHNRVVDISLAARLYPDLALHPPADGDPGFERSRAPLPRLEWLNQTVVLADGTRLSLRDLIRWVCDKDGGAHVDPPAGRVPVRGGLGSGTAGQDAWIAALCDYILSEMGQGKFSGLDR